MGSGPRRSRRELDRESFGALLDVLGPEPARAGERYEAIRTRLLRFFTWRGASAPEELADDTFDRVCRRLAEGEIIRAADAAAYFLGVARNVLREAWERERRHERIEAEALRLAPPPAPVIDDRPVLTCLHRCLQALPAETRQLLLEYYECDGREQIDRRKELAGRLAVPPNALRIRLYRQRARLETCVRACLAQGGETPPGAAPPSDEGQEE